MMKNDMLSVVYSGNDAKVADELSRLAELVGVDFTRGQGPAVLTFSDAEANTVVAHFHDVFSPYFPRGRVRLHVRDDTADILELLAAVGSTLRGRVVGVIGAHGGAGTTTLAAWLARLFAEGASAGLIDANPASVGIDHVLAIDAAPGKRWADLAGDGVILAGRLANLLPGWHGVSVVSADERGAMPNPALGAQVISALAQTQPWTVVDFSPVELVRSRGLAPGETAADRTESLIEWCDQIVLVTRADAVALAHARRRASELPGALVVGIGISGKSEAAHAADVIGVADVLGVRLLRGMRGDVDHGLAPGDRNRSGTHRDIQAIRERLEELIA
ncbi:hypothetical protein [Trueperella bialowiezensis]|uniref:Flp pilus assembly protein, ATPase CpaE n=1 Tax=Trueperella bialowiezensis TaxID=312285 RepID=A0A3S4V6M3_9ACTO|nr:hypothetical protein [Trueperella bialowiezensis]VEI13157.1 Flp pilus assembly protein, ATPase CpaE [Trueperella bialowiezensis]